MVGLPLELPPDELPLELEPELEPLDDEPPSAQIPNGQPPPLLPPDVLPELPPDDPPPLDPPDPLPPLSPEDPQLAADHAASPAQPSTQRVRVRFMRPAPSRARAGEGARIGAGNETRCSWQPVERADRAARTKPRDPRDD
jgi:hypothetical protein